MSPSPPVARSLCATLLVLLSLIEFLLIPLAFRNEAYLGVMFILSCGVTLSAALVLIATDRDAAWVFALVEGLLYIVSYLTTRFTGLPFLDRRLTADWLVTPALAPLYLGAVISALAGWTLLARRRSRRRRGPVTSARERAALLLDRFDE